MSTDGWIVLAVTAGVLVALVRNLAPPDVLFLGATAGLTLLGIITPTEALSGFSNSGVLTVAALFVVAAGLRETGVLDYLCARVMGNARTTAGALSRMAAVVVPLSAFLNNTPIVAMFMPMAMDWSRRHRVSPSKLLIPLSYLAILGGTCTLIGTSTNLVVNGLMIEHGMQSLGLFEIGLLGIPYAAIGCAYLLYGAPRWLPDRKELLEQLGESLREYVVEMTVQPGCRLAGKTVEEAGLRNLPGLFLIEIDRNGTIIGPVSPLDRITTGDRLVFTGVVSSILEVEKIGGLTPADPAYEVTPSKRRDRQLCEAVISERSPLIGKTIKEADFRAAYGAAVVAVHRGGERIPSKLGEVRLRPGDTLLLQTRPHFQRAYRNDPAFYLVSDVQEYRPLRPDRAWVSVAVFALLITLMTTGWAPTVTGALLAAVLMVAFGCISAGDARQSVEWLVIVTIAAAFGLGAALEGTGAAGAVAEVVVEWTRPLGPVAALACIYIIGSLATEIITNNAAAVLLFPFCLETAERYGISPTPLLLALMFSASASFVTPIGYQTNMMVYGPGGYRYGDYIRFGTPLNVALCVVAVILIPIIWPFHE